MDRARVDVDGIEQKRRAIRIRVKPSFERDLFDHYRFVFERH